MRKTSCVALVAVLLVAEIFMPHLAPPAGPAADRAELGTAPVSKRNPAGYFRTGQWRADARTLVAALDFLLTPEGSSTNRASMRA